MKKCQLLGFIITFVICMLPRPVLAQNPNDFSFQSFEADYFLSKNDSQASVLFVKEKIVAEFPQTDQNHGIERAIPSSYDDHSVNLEINEVRDGEGNPLRYTTYDSNDNKVLRIGDPNTYVHGQKVYEIEYRMRNVMFFDNEQVELYWDVNGFQWPQDFKSVIARIHIPATIASELKEQQRCFKGVFGSSESNCVITREPENGGTLVTVSASDVGPAETLTFVLAFNKGTFIQGPEVAREQMWQQIVVGLLIAGAVAPPIITGFWVFSRWKKYGRDPEGRGIIVPEYQPPKRLDVMASDVVLHESLGPKAITAQIIELAVQGYVAIYETSKKKLFSTSKDYDLELTKDPLHLNEEQRTLIGELFPGEAVGTRIKLTDLKNKLYSHVKELEKKVGSRLHNLGYFRTDPSEAKSRYMIRGVAVAAIGFVALTLAFLFLPFFGIGTGLVVSGLVIMIASKIMPARTEQGVITREYLLGLKEYIRMAEKDRIAYLQSPNGAEKLPAGTDIRSHEFKVHLFESLLPYAVLYGMEKDWAKQFKGLYDQPPNWYHGDFTTFNVAYLASSLGSFSSATQTAFTAPSSSGSSGFSSGGGFSGGGGGGGGGGGW